MILCLSSKHLNKIVDSVCLYVFYINPFSVVHFSASRHTLCMLHAIEYCSEDSIYPKIALIRLPGIGRVVVYV